MFSISVLSTPSREINMNYKTILLHLDNEEHATELVRFTTNLAYLHGAHLIGLFVIHPMQTYVGRAGAVSMAKELSTLLVKDQIDRMKRLQAIFEQETKNQDFNAEWRFIDERIWPVADTLVQEATTADLVIVGSNPSDYATKDVLNTVLLSSPVPVLVVPNNYKAKEFGKNVLIAWDGKTEAARAVYGAKPILQTAENVWVHHARTKIDTDTVVETNMKELAENLSRHGIAVEISESIVDRKGIGKALSTVAMDHGVDCVVMGAYGHSKLRNLILGNTTDYALSELNLPLLMWH